MYVGGPQFTFTDLQMRHDLKTGKKNVPAMATAIELDKGYDSKVVTHDYGKYSSGTQYNAKKDLDYHLQFNRLL